MFRSILPLAAAFAFLISAPVAHAAEKYTLDRPHTQVIFSVSHLGFTDSWGRFLDYDGSFTFDRVNPANSSVDVTVKTDSLDMGDAKWDEHLKSADFLDTAKFPTMTFKSTGITVTGQNTADITGDMTILGVTKPVTLKVTHNKSGVFPMDDKMFVAGFSATAKIKRSDFGMTKYLPMIGDDVEIHLEVQGNQEGYAGPDKGKE
jgi:polyisoprenoid-binding protein YceI